MCHLLIMLSNHQHYRAQAEKSRVWAVDSFLPSYQYTASIKACFFRRVIIRGSRPGVRWVRAGGLEVGDFPSPYYQSSKCIFYGSMKPPIFQNILFFWTFLVSGLNFWGASLLKVNDSFWGKICDWMDHSGDKGSLLGRKYHYLVISDYFRGHCG